MKHINHCLSSFFKKIALLLFFSAAFNFAYAQCPIPFPKGDIDSTLRNIPVSTVVTRNDITYFGSGVAVSGDSLSISQAPLHGTVIVLNDSTIRYTPYPGFVGTDFYIYTVCNSCGNCSQASVSIEVKPYCPAPVARADYYTVYNNIPSTLNVTSNDQNIAGGPLTVSISRSPHHGAVSVSGNQVTYTATQNTFIGLDTFVYLVRDTCPAGYNYDTAFVYLNVVTCQPVVAMNDTFTVQQQSSISGDVSANDQHASGFGIVTVTLLNSPKYGSAATVTGAVISYTAGANGFGTDSIKYKICTDCGCDTAYAIFRVTQKPCAKPKAVPDNEYAGYSINCISIFNILSNDSIPINGGALTVTLLGAPLFGRATIVNGTLHYTCTDSTKVGQTDFIRYSICNACFCDTTFVGINITNNPCNGLNPVVNKDSASVCVNYAISIDVTANDYSPQGLPVRVRAITGQGAHGTANILNGSTITYTPNAGFTGTDYFVYQACDNGSPSLCNIATVVVNVASCTAPPQVLNTAGNPTDTLHISVYEDSSRTYCFTYVQLDSPQVLITTISPSLDTIYALTSTPGSTPCIYIAPPTNSRAEQSVSVTICNETPTCVTVVLIISVIPLNHRPVANIDAINYSWSSPCGSVNALNNDTDIDPGDHIRITSFDSVTANGGKIRQTGDSTFCYTPDSSFSGIDTFYYTICDTSNLCSSAYITVKIPIQARNDYGMTTQDSGLTLPVTANDTRSGNEYLSICSQPEHGSVIVQSDSIIYSPVHDYPINPLGKDTVTYAGMDSFCYTLCSVTGTDTSCASAEVYIVIQPKAKFYIPQGISPNGDGVNDKFVIASADEFPLSQLLVYNRYGDEVWRNDGDGYKNDFGGTWEKNGQPLPDGSYWYIFKFNDGVTHDRMGYIVIQR